MIWDKRLSFKLLNLQGERSHIYEYFILVVIWDISLGLSYWTIAIISNCNMFDRKLEIFCWTCLFLFRKWLLYFSHQHNLGIPPVEGENSSTYFLILWKHLDPTRVFLLNCAGLYLGWIIIRAILIMRNSVLQGAIGEGVSILLAGICALDALALCFFVPLLFAFLFH